MNILGLIGQQYMFLLLVVLFLGFGLGTWAILKSLFSKEKTKGPVKTSVNSNSSKAKNIATDSKITKVITKVIGGINMNNGWLKLGLFSLVGLVISFTILGFISSSNSYNMNMANGMNMNGNMNTQGTMNMTMNNNGMSNSTNTMNMNGQTMNSSYDTNMQNQLYQMQMQLNQMQMQLQNMNNSNNGQMQTQMPNSNNMSNSNTSSNSSMSSGGSGMGMMGM